jgi:hypothetical protein
MNSKSRAELQSFLAAIVEDGSPRSKDREMTTEPKLKCVRK